MINLEGYSVRFANADDSKDFVEWINNSNKIPRKDVEATMSAVNPTTVFLVIEKEGKVVLFAPIYCQINLAYLGFNPEITDREDRRKALEALKLSACGFALEHGVNEITVQTSKDYPVGKWALNNGFEEESRSTFKLKAIDTLKKLEEEQKVSNVL